METLANSMLSGKKKGAVGLIFAGTQVTRYIFFNHIHDQG
jgi:hypothetical protein